MVNIVDRISRRLAGILFWVAGASIVLMMLLTCADVILRYFRMPIPGAYELVCFLGALAVAFAMAHTSVQGGHVAVSIVAQLLPKRGQAILGTVTDFFSLVFFALVGWQSIRYGEQLKASGEVSLTLELPFYPFVYGVGIAAFAVCLVLIKRILENAQKAVQPWT